MAEVFPQGSELPDCAAAGAMDTSTDATTARTTKLNSLKTRIDDLLVGVGIRNSEPDAEPLPCQLFAPRHEFHSAFILNHLWV
jgi:hypothetical protein